MYYLVCSSYFSSKTEVYLRCLSMLHNEIAKKLDPLALVSGIKCNDKEFFAQINVVFRH